GLGPVLALAHDWKILHRRHGPATGAIVMGTNNVVQARKLVAPRCLSARHRLRHRLRPARQPRRALPDHNIADVARVLPGGGTGGGAHMLAAVGRRACWLRLAGTAIGEAA